MKRMRLKFEDVDKDGYEFNVYHKKEYLGWIQYDEDWKCWVFTPSEVNDVVPQFSWDCLQEIVNFMKRIKKPRKEKIK